MVSTCPVVGHPESFSAGKLFIFIYILYICMNVVNMHGVLRGIFSIKLSVSGPVTVDYLLGEFASQLRGPGFKS